MRTRSTCCCRRGRSTRRRHAHLGLVNWVVDRERVVEAATEYAADIAANCSPVAMAAIKQQVYDDWHRSAIAAEEDWRRLIAETHRKATSARASPRTSNGGRHASAPTWARPTGPTGPTDRGVARRSRRFLARAVPRPRRRGPGRTGRRDDVVVGRRARRARVARRVGWSRSAWTRERSFPRCSSRAPNAIASTVAGALWNRPVAPLGPRLGVDELAHCVRGVDAGVLVTDAASADLAASVGVRTGAAVHVLPDEFACADRDVAPAVDGAQLVAYLHTSGTTGYPKAVPVREGALALRVGRNATALGLDRSSIYVTAAGYHHIAGLGMLFVVLGSGGAICAVPVVLRRHVARPRRRRADARAARPDPDRPPPGSRRAPAADAAGAAVRGVADPPGHAPDAR